MWEENRMEEPSVLVKQTDIITYLEGALGSSEARVGVMFADGP